MEEPTGAGQRWQLWIDTGGTFTDCVAIAPGGQKSRAKVLSNGRVRGVVASRPDLSMINTQQEWDLPDGFFSGAKLRGMGPEEPFAEIVDYDTNKRLLTLDRELGAHWLPRSAFEIHSGVEAPVLAAHWLTRTPLAKQLPATTMRLATTRGTNALLERSGSATALFITRGFADLLEIGNQQRPDLFALAVRKRRPLYAAVEEVQERIDSQGDVLEAIDLEAVRTRAVSLLDRGISVAAVALLNSYCNPSHEQALCRLLAEVGFEHVSSSAELAPLIKIVPRAETAVVNAYLSPVISRYLESVGSTVDPGPLHVLTSAGSLVRSTEYLPKDSLLSGPAGGVVGAAAKARASGFARSLAFDMGGTSTDVSRYDGELDYRYQTTVGDALLLSPSLAIETVAAGGGSICSFDGRQLKVGPESAGADPGPACYGAGGPLTLTDVNLLLGRLDPQSFQIPIDARAARSAADRLGRDVELGRGSATTVERLMLGLLMIANERMAEAVRRISVRQGYRPSEFALVAFGGAGGQHACALAEILGIETILVPADAGLLSAVGLGQAGIERLAELQVLRPLESVISELPALIGDLASQVRTRVSDEGVAPDQVEIRQQRVHLRLQGQETSLPIDFQQDIPLDEEFCRAYEDHYGYRPEEPDIELESIRVLAATKQGGGRIDQPEIDWRRVEAEASQRTLIGGGWQDVPVFERQALVSGDTFCGPALVFEQHCATLVGMEWRARVDHQGSLVVCRQKEIAR